ncbi:hypothetical protein [Enterobacter sp. 22466]|uniref:hypothetical protein n=1 Tax=Enterobacter sp. 22466 TaxID=3453924 RepID=UPI003F86808F
MLPVSGSSSSPIQRATTSESKPSETAKTEGEYREIFSQCANEFQALRNISKTGLFFKLDELADLAQGKGPVVVADVEEFFGITQRIAQLEGEALGCVEEYKTRFQEFKAAHCNKGEALENIPWLAGGDLPVSHVTEQSAIESLIKTEEMTKKSQLQVFVQEDIKDNHLVPHEKIIVGRAIQRFLNATTLTLNSSLGGPACNNIKGMAKLTGADVTLPADQPEKWSVPLVRERLSPQLKKLYMHISKTGSSSTLSADAMHVLKDKCDEVLRVVDRFGIFNVPEEMKQPDGV